MGRRLILDTNVLIAYERGTIDRARLDEDDLAISAVTVAGYRAGIELADTPERAADSRGEQDHPLHRDHTTTWVQESLTCPPSYWHKA